MGLTAGNAQAAQGMSFLAFPFVFVSSAYVPGRVDAGLAAADRRAPAGHARWSGRCGRCSSATTPRPCSATAPAWFTVRALAWCVVIVAVFLPLCTRRFARP